MKLTRSQKINVTLFYIIGIVFITITVNLKGSLLGSIFAPFAVITLLIMLGIPYVKLLAYINLL